MRGTASTARSVPRAAISCTPTEQGDGTPYKPDAVTRRFQRLAALAGLPVIKLHEGRHSAASLARDAAVDPEIRRRTLGHADAAMTAHYTHIEAEAHKAAAEAVAKLVEGASSLARNQRTANPRAYCSPSSGPGVETRGGGPAVHPSGRRS